MYGLHYMRQVEIRRQGEAVAAYHGRVAQAHAHRLRSLNVQKQERKQRITAKKFRTLEPLLKAFAGSPSTDVAQEALAVNEAYTQALASDQVTTP